MVGINADSLTPQQHHHRQLRWGPPVFIAQRDGESCMYFQQLHGLHAAQQCLPGTVPQNTITDCSALRPCHRCSRGRQYQYCLLCAVPAEVCFGQVMYYESCRLDQLPMHWAEFKYTNVVIAIGHGEVMALAASSKDYSVWSWTCSRAPCCGPACAWPAMCSEERPSNKSIRTALPPW